MAAVPEKAESASQAETSLRFSRIGMLWRGPIAIFRGLSTRAIFILASALITITTLGTALAILNQRPKAEHIKPTPELALKALDGGLAEEARRLAAELRQLDDPGPEIRSISAFVLGKVLMNEAENEANYAERKARYLLAARYFQESAKHGIPEDRRPDLAYSLGRSLYSAERWVESQPALQNALQLNPQHVTSLHRILANAYLRSPQSKDAEATEHILQFLKDPSITQVEREHAQLELGQICLRTGDREGCIRTIASISEDSLAYGRALVLQGRVQLDDGDRLLLTAGPMPSPEVLEEAVHKYKTAQQTLQLAVERAGSDVEAERPAQYLLGLCLRKLGDYAAAENHFRKTSRSYFTSSEGFASQLEQAEIQLVLQKHDVSLKSFQRLLSHIEDSRHFSNSWVTMQDLRVRAERAFRTFLDAGKIEHAIDLTHVFGGLVSDDLVIEMRAEARRANADQLFQQAKNASVLEFAAIEAKARREARDAGRLFGELAALRTTAQEHPDLLWSSAENYLRGQDYPRAVSVLTSFKESQPRKNHAPILLALGEADLALHNPDQALVWLNECLQFFPKHPLAYRARILASTAFLELGRVDEAKQSLQANLDHENLTPISLEWRAALFELGRILYYEGLERETASRLAGVDNDDPQIRKVGLKDLEVAHEVFQQAARKLSEAIQRFPNDPQSTEARYLLAETQRHLAMLPRKRIPTINIETSRVVLTRQLQQDLTIAVATYRDLLDRLNQKQEQTDLSQVETLILRNAYFGYADSLYDLGRYDDAIRAYSLATNRFQTEPESLEAYVQIASCHRHMERPAEAHGAIEQAKAVLQRIRPDAEFTRTTRHDRAGWQQLLDWLTTVYETKA